MDDNKSIIFRKFLEKDSKDVRKICFSHFRSLTFPAVLYYIFHNGQDMIAFYILGLIYLNFSQLFIIMSLFFLYLTIRARLELEAYISYNCPDLDNIAKSYTDSERSNFWIAELVENCMDDESCSSVSTNSNQIGSNSNSFFNFFNIFKLFQHIFFSSKNINNKKRVLVGCIGVSPYKEDPTIAHLVRLVVSSESRRMRIGSRLLSLLQDFAINAGYKELRLYTNNLKPSSLTFAKQSGFKLIQNFRRGLMRGDLLVWRKVLIEHLRDSSSSENVTQVIFD